MLGLFGGFFVIGIPADITPTWNATAGNRIS